MELHNFLSPVELEQPPEHEQPKDFSVSRGIHIHTPDHSISNPEKYDLAILGIPEDRNSFNKGAAKAPDKIRQKLYQLRGFSQNLNIIDLGNIIPGKNITDTYYATNEVLNILNYHNIPVLIFGGTQNLTIGSCMSLKKKHNHYKLLTIDSRIDYNNNSNNENYLNEILDPAKEISPMDYISLGYQSYFVNQSVLDELRNKNYRLNRLGLVRSNIHLTEPEVRDTHIISIDISSIKQSDAPGHINGTPNGFYGEEICQIARYAGLGEKVTNFGIYEVNPDFDNNHQTAHLAAQIGWYFIEGYSQRANENPMVKKDSFKKFIVTVNKLDKEIVFFKSMVTNRWWMQIPVDKEIYQKKDVIISCSSQDYDIASQDEIPDRWLETFHRYN